MIHILDYKASTEDTSTEFVHSGHSGCSEPPLHRFNWLRLAPYAHLSQPSLRSAVAM